MSALTLSHLLTYVGVHTFCYLQDDKIFAYFVHSKRDDLAKLARSNSHGVSSSYPSKLIDFSLNGSASCPQPQTVDRLTYSLGQRVWSHYGHDKDE